MQAQRCLPHKTMLRIKIEDVEIVDGKETRTELVGLATIEQDGVTKGGCADFVVQISAYRNPEKVWKEGRLENVFLPGLSEFDKLFLALCAVDMNYRNMSRVNAATPNEEMNKQDEIREKRAAAIAAMNLVTREGDRFKVATPALRNCQTTYEISRDPETRKVKCTCLEFEDEFAKDPAFRCEHILAVKKWLESHQQQQKKAA
jgi:hypothetical protein